MKVIAVEEHFLTDTYRNFLRSREEFPKRDIVEQAGKKFEREWWSLGLQVSCICIQNNLK